MTNRALSYAAFGSPTEVLKLVDEAPTTLGPHDVRVRMRLAAIHNHDLWMIRGSYGQRPPLPAVGGSEAVGEITELGAGVSGLRVGQRVATLGVPVWRESYVIADKAVVPVPDAIDDAAACQLVAMPLSAMMLLEDAADLPAGSWLAQNAANGAVGTTLAHLAKARGVQVLNVVRRAAAIEELAHLGITNAVATDTPGLRERVRAITGGAPIVRAIDSVGAEESKRLMSVVADGGTLVVFGSMSGEPVAVDPGELIFRGKRVEGFWAMTWKPKAGRADSKALVGQVIQAVATGTLKLTVDSEYPLSEAAAAFAAHEKAGRHGKVAFRGT